MTVDPSDVLLADHVSVITGAAQGIGAASAVGLAKFGSDVVICDRDAEGLEKTAVAVAASGRRVLSFNIDVRDYDAVDEMFDSVNATFGRLDVLVNNAGGTFFSPFEAVSPKGEQALIAENFTSVTHCIRRAVGLMAERGGAIVNITSIEAHRAAPGFAIYAAMKTAVMGLTKTLALESATRRIRVNCIAPDMIFTEASRSFIGSMPVLLGEDWREQPLPDAGTVDDAARAVIFLAGAMSRFVTGTTLHLDGGNWASGGWKLHEQSGTYTNV